MSFIRNTDKLVEGLQNKWFTSARAKSAVQGDLDQLAADISSEASARQSAVSDLQGQINNVLSNVDPEALDSLTEIVSAFQAADSDLNSAISSLAGSAGSNLAAEEAARIAADEVLQSNIDAEQAARILADENLDIRIGDLLPLSIASTPGTLIDQNFLMSMQIIAALNQSGSTSGNPTVQANWSNIETLVIKTTDGLIPSGVPGSTNLDFDNSFIVFSGDSALYRLSQINTGPFAVGAVGGYQFSESDGNVIMSATAGVFRLMFFNPESSSQIRFRLEFSFVSGQQRVTIFEYLPGNTNLNSPNYSVLQNFSTGTRAFDLNAVYSESVPLPPSVFDLFSFHDARLDVLEADSVTKSYVDSADSTLQNNINSESSARQSADSTLQNNINSESSARQSADSTLQNNINSEEAARIAADSALSGRLDVLEADPVTKAYVDGEVSDLQGQINTEKGRIDAILDASEADKDSFAEIVQLINSVDTANDEAFAGYVLSNDAALAQEVSDRQSGDSALSGRLDVLEADPVTKAYVDGIDSALDARLDVLEADPVTKAYVDGIDSALDARLDVLEADPVTKAYVDGIDSALDARLDVLEADPTTKAYVDGIDSALDARLDVLEADPVTKAYVDGIDSALDARLDVLEADPVTKAYVDGIDSALDARLDVLEADPVTKAYVDQKLGPVTGVSSNLSLSSQSVLLCDVSEGTVTLTLPEALSAGSQRRFVIKDSGSASQSTYIRIQCPGSEKIDGESYYDIAAPYESITVFTDGSNWYIV
jgi:hypothetical protein